MRNQYLILCSQQLMQTIRESYVPASQRRHSVSIIKAKQLFLCKGVITVYYESRMKHINTFCGKIAEKPTVYALWYILSTALQMINISSPPHRAYSIYITTRTADVCAIEHRPP